MDLPRLRSVPTRWGRMGCFRVGQGAPSLLLFHGAGLSVDAWRPLFPEIEALGTVFAWNRFGLPGSDPPRLRQSGLAVVLALREALVQAGVAPPYVLVGHSLGGLHANLFARRHPEEVAAVALIEATHPRDRDMLRRLAPRMEAGLRHVGGLSRRRFQRNLHAELQGLEDTARQVAAAGPFPPVPLAVVTGGLAPPVGLMSPAAAGARRAHQQELARLSPWGRQVIAHRSGHFPQLTQPQLVLRVIADLVEAARRGQRVVKPL